MRIIRSPHRADNRQGGNLGAILYFVLAGSNRSVSGTYMAQSPGKLFSTEVASGTYIAQAQEHLGIEIFDCPC